MENTDYKKTSYAFLKMKIGTNCMETVEKTKRISGNIKGHKNKPRESLSCDVKARKELLLFSF